MIIKTYENDYGISVLAYNENEVIGCANTSRISNNTNTFYFNRLFVQPKFRNQKCATKILNTLLNIFKEKHYVLALDINPYGDLNYEELEKFYIKNGFKKYRKYNKIIGNFYTYYFNKEE